MSKKVRENRLRRLAQRQGLMLVKGRRREDRDTYILVADCAGNRVGRYGGQAAVSEFHNGWGMTLDEVEHAVLTH